MKAFKFSLKCCVLIPLFLFFTGCAADVTNSYVGEPNVTETSVHGNLSWAQRSGHEKVLLKQEWLEEFLVSLRLSGASKPIPLYFASDIKPIMPAIQQSIAECGNVTINVEGWTTFLSVRKGKLYCDTRGRVRTYIEKIPANAYEKK